MGKRSTKIRIIILSIAVVFTMILIVGMLVAKGKRATAGFSNICGALGPSKQWKTEGFSLPGKDRVVAAFTVQELDKAIIKSMMNNSYKPNKDIKLKDLRLVKVTYLGFDNEAHKGELIVNKEVSLEVAQIFKELYEAEFQVERIEQIDLYGGKDEKSMEANNTSCFNYRRITGGKSLSNHALGLAIDINPVRNPYIFEKQVLPKNSGAYLNRENLQAGMITREGVCYKIFKKYGWSWGGDWRKPTDYQHFEKKLKGK